jgi:hypothetical protein
VKNWAYYLQAAFKMAALCLCLVVIFGGKHPPASAQIMTSAVDAVQNEKIEEANHHLEVTDSRVTNQWSTLNARIDSIALQTQANAIAANGTQTELRVWGSVLALLVSSGIILQVRKKAV